ncbi:PDDEXK family nuclease [Bifidobacterium leontopitheci]|uniref:DNA mismatch endonuclease Vsr n=1 Tax=Bifidobacterium leontopitheci TaxID=2650774 RepID=A0A6I1GRF1_9BIFI|nr:hypothetical protein [Bifidobacterium leontopitheci]KAB7790728.1 DNA mismatch endonuclease Vsr [Bifidobacterium leontopitheci]
MSITTKRKKRNAQAQASPTAGCSSGKRRYRTKLDAKIALASARKLKRGPARPKDERRYYFCPDCYGYHLTSKPYWNRTATAKKHVRQTPATVPPSATIKGVAAFVECIDGSWIYTIPEFAIRGASASQQEAKTTVRAMMKIVAPGAKTSFRYYSDDQDIELFYAKQVAGSQAEVTTDKDSYMEPLLAQLRSRLFRNGFRFRKYDSRYEGTPDIVLPKYRIMVFVDACLWHDRAECRRRSLPPETLRIWHDAHAESRGEALECRQRLAAEGWIILTYWECWFCDNRKREKRLGAFLADVRRSAALGSTG